MGIDKEKLLSFVSQGSTLSRDLSRFEIREAQKEMLSNVVDAFNNKKIALIEAGTGVGKSFAYLIPALFFAHTNQEKVVISTHTIHLQEQLFFKDIPLLLKNLNLDLKISIAVGMGNYICKLKCKEDLLGTTEIKEKLFAFAKTETDGKRSSVPFSCSQADWEEVAVDYDSCVGMKCPHYQDCFFFKDRKKIQESQIIIANHYLLISDLNIKQKSDLSPLPEYAHVIVDEAHHLEAVATKLFAEQLSMKDLFKLLNRLITEGATSRQGRVNQFTEASPELLLRQIELAGEKRAFAQIYNDFFEVLSMFLGGGGKKRLTKATRDEILFKEGLHSRALMTVQEGKRFCQNISSLKVFIEDKEDAVKKRMETTFAEIENLTTRIKEGLDLIDKVILNVETKEFVAFVEGDSKEIKLINAPIDVSQKLKEHLFEPMQSSILLSATLATQNKFTFIKQRLGIDKEPIEALYPSPFNYKEQSLFIIPKDLPPPEHSSFLSSARGPILDCLEASRGRAFILFTSHSSMVQTYLELYGVLKEKKFNLFKQGDASRRDLIEQFKASKRGVLFGTDSFWEGVDIAGEKLSAVILYKLPFAAPNDPIIEAQAEFCQSKGQKPFFDYHLPKAIVKFKQGFGRLIRHTQDRGVVLCLDPRLVTKNYGSSFLKSLPPIDIKIIDSKECKETLHSFFKN